MSHSILIVLFGYALVIAVGVQRCRSFGIFIFVVLSFPTLGCLFLTPFLGPFGNIAWVFHSLGCLHFMALATKPRMQGRIFRASISVPALWFVASTFLALPWIIVAGFGGHAHLAWLPFALAIIGVFQTLWTREEDLDLTLNNKDDLGPLKRCGGSLKRRSNAAKREKSRALKIVQISDPHLGPFMSVARLRKICDRAVEREPDLILITGDLMTMESQDVDIVKSALQPLEKAKGKVFACHGNHDLEARDVVSHAFGALGITLLIDHSVTVETPVGSVQIVGCDFVWRERKAHLATLCKNHPRIEGALRLVLLHDPGAFKHLPAGEGDLVLSGHTHGGQVGLLSLGLPTTFLSLVSKIPDHGLWARGHDRLYVHRTQGVYGFPLRIGVPAEQSLLHLYRFSTPA